MRIFVPSRGRIGTGNLITPRFAYLDAVSKRWLVTYVVPQSEAHPWRDRYDNTELHLVPDEYRFSEVRQHIATAQEFRDDHDHVVVDDDLYFFRRTNTLDPEDVSLRACSQVDILEMFMAIEMYLKDGYAHGGISAREGNNRLPIPHVEIARCMRLHFYDASVLRAEGFDFRDIPTKQDFHCTLTLLELGYPNIVNTVFCHNQRGSGSEGGCSAYRDAAMMESSARRLHELHPEFVKVVNKETKTAWGGGERVDVQIQWKKAFCTRESARKGT